MDETTIDLRDVIKTLKKRRRLILSIFAFFTIASLVISFIIPPTYEGETTLRIKQPKGLANSLLADLPVGNSANTKQQMSTYAEILKSRTVVQEVIDKTQQDKEKPPTYDTMLKRITTKPVKDTEILEVTVQAGSAEEAELVTNTLVDTFLKRMTGLVRSEQSTVREFIGERLAESKKELETAEAALQKYKQEQMIVSPDDESKALVDKLAAIDKLSADNRVALAASQANFSSANRQLGNEKPGFVADNALITQYKTKLADLEVQRVGLIQSYTDKNPKVQAVDAAIQETRSRLNDEIIHVVNANAPSMNPVHQGILQAKLQSEAEIAAYSAQRQAIDAILAEDEKVMGTIPAKQQGLIKVMRDASVAQEIYVMLAKRHEEARISEVMEPTDVQIVDVAIAPEKPIKPKKALNTVIGAILGLFVGTGIAFLLEYMNRTIRTAEEVKHYLDLPVLGSVPDFDSKPKIPKESVFQRVVRTLEGNKNKSHQA